ncbi:hypothetical protein MCA0803 [Methylococcus capsulatus str. Bath]|uniref:Uncharacterized protein n=1 Tax=Methylococcus capsulatus (strain ATCC 33009 / NCIMB 11132 / Bath) TaxID=243233 RepID=Q60AP4_METCA|nr:hypothetical protein MCA0803 [Methylococcus capsulatus str. Bath]
MFGTVSEELDHGSCTRRKDDGGRGDGRGQGDGARNDGADGGYGGHDESRCDARRPPPGPVVAQRRHGGQGCGGGRGSDGGDAHRPLAVQAGVHPSAGAVRPGHGRRLLHSQIPQGNHRLGHERSRRRQGFHPSAAGKSGRPAGRTPGGVRAG